MDFDTDFDCVYEALLEDIGLLGDIQIIDEDVPLLSFPDFCRINKLIKKYTHPVMVPSLKKLIDKRREALVKEDTERYRELALIFSECEENFTQRVSDVVLEHF